jgi:hypothetical protein
VRAAMLRLVCSTSLCFSENYENKSKPGNEARENLYKKHAIDFQKVYTE